MRVRIKICGITSAQARDAAVEAGADAIGFVFAPSSRQVSVAEAIRLAHDLPPLVTRVAVMRHPTPEQAREVLESFRPHVLQSDRADFGAITLPPGCAALAVIREGTVGPQQDLPRLFLYEGADSGAGETVDWGAAGELARSHRLMLAGGLNPTNVGEAVARVRPFAVDVSSGVESAPGIKDPERIRAFIRAVRRAESQLGD